MRAQKKATNIYLVIFFVIYMLALIKIVLFKDALFYNVVDTNEGYKAGSSTKTLLEYNLVPFRNIRIFINGVKSFNEVFFNIAGNVLLFIPLGFLLPVLFKKLQSWIRIMLIAAFLSFSFEVFQLITRTGACDIDDLILNTTGGLIGYFLFYLFIGRRRTQSRHQHLYV